MIPSTADGEKNMFGNPTRLNSLFTHSSIYMYELRTGQIQDLDLGCGEYKNKLVE